MESDAIESIVALTLKHGSHVLLDWTSLCPSGILHILTPRRANHSRQSAGGWLQHLFSRTNTEVQEV